MAHPQVTLRSPYNGEPTGLWKRLGKRTPKTRGIFTNMGSGARLTPPFWGRPPILQQLWIVYSQEQVCCMCSWQRVTMLTVCSFPDGYYGYNIQVLR
jgi:hypothetical protein